MGIKFSRGPQLSRVSGHVGLQEESVPHIDREVHEQSRLQVVQCSFIRGLGGTGGPLIDNVLPPKPA